MRRRAILTENGPRSLRLSQRSALRTAAHRLTQPAGCPAVRPGRCRCRP